MQIWDLVTGEQTKNLKGHTDRVLTLQFDDYKIGTTPLSLCVCVSFRQRTTPSLSPRACEEKEAVAHVHGSSPVSGSFDQTVKIWNIETGVCQHTLGAF